VAISGINAKHEQQLAAQGITSVDDLERVHFDLHLGDMGRTRQFLQARGIWQSGEVGLDFKGLSR
jgi:hypothetical protein